MPEATGLFEKLVGFSEAASLVASGNGMAAFAFHPMTRGEWMAGGTILILHRPESDDTPGWEINVSSGFFNEPVTESEIMRPRDFKAVDMEGMLGFDLRHLRYRMVKEELAMLASWCGIQTALGILHGMDEQDAEKLKLETRDLLLLPGQWQGWLGEHMPDCPYGYGSGPEFRREPRSHYGRIGMTKPFRKAQRK